MFEKALSFSQLLGGSDEGHRKAPGDPEHPGVGELHLSHYGPRQAYEARMIPKHELKRARRAGKQKTENENEI